MEEIKKIYKKMKKDIKNRLQEFKNIWLEGNEERIFSELIFCLMTPQTKAKNSWKSVENILKDNFLIKGTQEEIYNSIYGVRFKEKKSGYIILAREKFLKNGKIKIKDFLSNFKDVFELRDWLVKNIKGFGYKESSHFLRNIGFGKHLTILDRHILKNLKLLKVIDEIPKSLTRKKYLEIEAKMIELSKNLNIPLDHLDFILWYKETGEIFK